MDSALIWVKQCVRIQKVAICQDQGNLIGESFTIFVICMPFAVYWMRSHFVNVPTELSEAARVDGATIWGLFWRIHIPLARAPMVSLGILMSVWTWNQFLLSLVLVEDPTQRTMAGALGAFQGHYATNVALLCAGTILILLPTLIIFILFQRQIIAALLEGSVKG